MIIFLAEGLEAFLLKILYYIMLMILILGTLVFLNEKFKNKKY